MSEEICAKLLTVPKYMLLLGCLTPKELRDVPLIVTGETRDFVASRGYELAKLCRWRRG